MKKVFTLCVVLCLSYLSMGATNLKHEFRATWLTTAWGNDWPKTKVTNATTRKQQQDSLIAIFDRLQAGNMNAVCLQVRGRSDAFYQSSYEPWAAELAGARGKDPGYDPLAFAIEEAHKRGLELHAWVNPFRVTSAGTLASTDLVKKNAGQWIIQYNNGSFTGEIIDPGYPEAREYVLNVLMEIINNYDIDGIVMDDYFYPYGGTTTEDAASKALHKPANVVDVNQDGDTDDDWRRSNVDLFLEELYDRIQTKKPWVRFGMGTFGIWTTQSKVAQAYGIALPSGISGLDDYDEQACNPVEWVQNGYVDYINPQLYWPTTSTGQNYNKLCHWWAKDVCEHFSNQLTNGKKVHFFSSQSISSNSAVSEIQAEIDANRSNLSSGYTGSVFFDTDAYLTMDKDLMTSRFATNALTPPMDWKSKTALSAPTNLTISGTTLTWQHATAERFTVYVYPKGTAWSTAKNDPAYLQGVIYGNSLDISGIDTTTHHIAVCAYDRFGVEHETAIYGATPDDVTPPASGTITYELNGGVQSEWETPQDMYNELNAIWNAFSGSTSTWGELETLKANVAQGIPTLAGGMALTFIADENFKAKFKWLVTYMDAKCAEQGQTLPSSNASYLRYNLQAFFIDGVRAGWPVSANYTTCGVSTLDAYQPYWKSSFANPTEPTAEVTLYAPYKEGATFDGWYAAADFSGEKVTKIDANTTGTLYAKWVEYIPTIAEVKALADDVVTNVSGVVNHIQGKNVYIQDATGGILVYTSEYPTCKVGDKIVVKGVKTIYAGAPEVKNAVINTTEASTLAQSQTFEGLSELVADMKHFATRVTVPGLKIVSYDGYNIPTVTDGVNQTLCYRMPLDPAQFPIGSKITITAVAGWYNGFQFVGDVAGIELVVVGKKDKYEYPVRNSETSSYTLINDWVISNNEDNFAANAPGKTDHVRGMAVKDGIMYFINRDTKSIVPVVGATAEMLDPIAITGEHLFERIGENGEWESACTLPFNDIEFDQSGNCLIGSCVSGDGTFQIYEVDLETGAATLVVEERLYDNPDFLNNGYRFDAFSVAGDVTQNGVIMAADGTSGSWNVYRWLITDGEVAPAEQITMLLDPEYDQSLFINVAGWGTGPQIFPQDEIGSLFYVDGFNMLPMLFDEGGMLVDDFINCPTQKEVTNKDGDVLMMNTGHNGLVEFQVGDEYFLLMAAGNTAAAVPSSFALFKFADEGRTFDGLEPLWYFPANGMGTSTNGCRTAPVSVEVEGNKAHLYLYTNNNGYARYTLNIGETTAEVIDPTWQITYTSTDGKIVTPYATDVFGANIVSNTYKDGVGTITFDGPVTSIGDSAFHGCQRLTYITIPNSVRSIENAFYCCYSLTSVTIPKSVTSIESRAFECCDTLISIVVENGNITYDSRDNCNAIIETATNTLVVGCKNTKIPESGTSIGSEAFYNCFSLTSITIPNSVTRIGYYAFYNCDGLTSITIPNSVTSIGEYAFYNCDGLTSVTIPESVTSIGDYAFGSSNLTSIVVESGNTTYDSRDNCHALIETATNTLIVGCKNTIIPESVTSIGGYAFQGCSSLTSITIPNNVTSIGEGAFRYCYSLTSITIPNSVTSIRTGTFLYCCSLTSITIPNSVTSIRTGAFSYCYGLTSVIIPNSVTSIGEHAFSYCSSLDTIYVEATTPPTLEDSTVFMNTPYPICYIPCGSLAAYEASDWAQYVSEFVEEGCPKITYELNGGVTNDYGWMSKNDMYHDLLVDINAIISTTSVDVDTVTLAYDKTKNIQEGIPTYWYDLSSLLTHSDFLSKWGWLINYMDSACAPESKYLPSTFSVYLRYNLSAFFFEKEYTSWPQTPDYSKYGLYPYYQPAWQHAYDNPTNPTEEFILNAPYREGYTFAGWYTNADLSGEKITIVEAETNDTLYAKWIENSLVESTWKVLYTSTNGGIVAPNAIDVFGANIVSNTYENGVGTITFDGPVTSIGTEAFHDCLTLKSITIPNSVNSIGVQAFRDCSAIDSLTIPENVNSISGWAFMDCSSLLSIVVAQENMTYDSRENCNAIIETATNTLIVGCKKTIIPNGVAIIGEHAFRISSLAFITIPNSVTNIERLAFCGSSIDTIYVEATTPPALADSTVFMYTPSPICVIPCGTLAAYEVSDWASQVGGFVEDCVEGQQIYYTSTNDSIVTPYNVNAFDANIVSNIYENGVGTITFDGPVTSIGEEAFRQCSSIASITIPKSVTSIGQFAFGFCSSLTSITIPENVTSIVRGTFQGCSSIVSIVVDNNNTMYDSRNDCNAIIETATNVLVTGCKNTIIPNGITTIDRWAFASNKSLASITIPNTVMTIADHAFHSCSSLPFISIPNSVTSIGVQAFYNCSLFSSFTIPKSVTTIGKMAFKDCTSLDTIYVEATTPPTLGENVLGYSPVFTSSPLCYLPCGTLSAYEASDWAQYVSEFVEEGCAPIQMCGDDLYWEYADGLLTITGTGEMYDYAKDTDVPWYDVRGNIKTVSLPDAMTKIGQNAFYKCTEMTTINMPTSLTVIGEKAFAQDTKLACEIILPASMTNIATRAFFNCKAVPAFHVEAPIPPTVQADAFDYTTAPIHVPCGYGHVYGKHTRWGMLNLEMCEVLQDNVYYYPIDAHTARAVTYHSNPTDTIVIPSAVVIGGVPRTVTAVADSAFMDCVNLPAIYFNEGLEYIGERAFVRCYSLHSTIILPATLETIGERAFSYCDNVEKYLIQAMTPPALGDGAFTCANHDALFYVSCEVMDDYKVAARWSSLKSRLRDACLNIYHYNTPLGTNGVYTTEDTLVASIYYRRQFTPYRWETLYLPFEVDRVTVLEDGVEYDLTAWDIVDGGHYFLAKPDGMLNKEILFGFTDELESHTPYIIQFSDAYYTDKLITFYGKESWNKLSTSFEVLSSSAWMQIAGNTTLQDQLLEKPVYMLRSGLDFILQKTTTTLHPFECYVMPYTAQSGAPARMNVRFRGDVPTAVESVKGNESHLTYTVDGYTLTVYPQGQAFSIYSLNGALIYSCEAGKEAVDCELNSGCYLLHAGTEAHKIML